MRICLVSESDELSMKASEKIVEMLFQKEFDVFADKYSNFLKTKIKAVENFKKGVIIVVGYDRTILRTIGRLEREIPVLGISVGEESFLAEIDALQAKRAFSRLKSGHYFLEKRKRIVAKTDGERTPPALNEIAIFSTKTATLISYTLRVDSEFVWKDSADGILISTPTGSTGYSLSVGGPILLQTSESFVITPVASVSRNVKPLVVSQKSTISVSDLSSRYGIEVVVDGYYRKKAEEEIIVKAHKKDAVFVRFEKDFHTKQASKIAKENIVKYLPPSAKYILKLLQYEKSMTQKELIEESMLPARTVRHALEILLKNGLVKKRTSLRDARQDIYVVTG